MSIHVKFSERYPEKWHRFSASDYNRPDLSDSDIQELSDYDNAVCYNDFVIHSIIDCFKEKDAFVDSVTFEEVVELKYIKNDYDLPGLNLDVYGYYTGLTFLNQIGLSQQVPAILEVVTNNTSCKRVFSIKNRKAYIQKGKIEVNRFNYKALQFFDMFYLINKEDIKENYKLLSEYINKNLSKTDFEKYIGLYPKRILKLIKNSGLIKVF